MRFETKGDFTFKFKFEGWFQFQIGKNTYCQFMQ